MPDGTAEAYTLCPTLPESARTLYSRFMEGLRRCDRQDHCQQDLTRAFLQKEELRALPLPDRLTTRLFLEVIDDLGRHGWQFDAEADHLTAIAPDVTVSSGRDREEIKSRLRAMLVAARDEQLTKASVRRFIQKMERPRWCQGRQVSVQDLFADPQDFATDLERRIDAEPTLREGLLYDMVEPYLQRATEARDTFTNLRLRDIWRYCRYTWSLPQKTQPGRRMAYLIRDAARPFHPIMGIGALGSSIVQITCRDKEVGWSLESLENSTDPAARMQALSTEIERAIDDIYRGDFKRRGILTEKSVEHPTTQTLAQFDAVADAPPTGRTRVGSDIPLREAACTPLYRYKRAKTLRELLRTRLAFQRAEEETSSWTDRLERLFSSSEGLRALKVALRSQKKRHVGSSMMNITTCGAIPPYNPVLGGKLVGLLMVSPQVIADYQDKYANSFSYIASRMRGAELTRRNELVLLETTSLYGIGSSQYNRLRAPVANGEVRYQEAGKTDGYGSVHLSERTYQTLQRLLSEHPDLDAESHEFGRGVNYKIRSIAAGLSHLGLAKLQKHKNSRLVYTIPVAENWKKYLTGQDNEPHLLYDSIAQPAAETEALVDFWKRRWFIKRVQKPMIRRRLRSKHGKVRVSDLWDVEGERTNVLTPTPAPSAVPTSTNGKSFMPSGSKISWSTLATLVGGRASFAERLSDKELAAIHISTKLDDGLIDVIAQGKRLYITGNPGDGKTHIIERYRSDLEKYNAFVNVDASATNEQSLASNLADAIANGRGAVVAVNEGPLRQLKNHLPAKERHSLEDQLNHPFLYGSEQGNVKGSDALLVNLGLRQILVPDTLGGVLNIVLNHVDYDNAPGAIRNNHNMLKHRRVQNRLKALMKRVGQSGGHVRMRNLLSFFAFIITGKASADPADTQPYYELAFHRESALYDFLKGLDPARIAHPLIDAQLWDGIGRSEIEWLETPRGPAPVECGSAEAAQETFKARKRRFFFEANHGDMLFSVIPKAQRTFFDLLENVKDSRHTAKQNLLRALAQFFGGSTDDDDEARLPIWTGLRYRADDGPPSALIASRDLDREDVSLHTPRLRPAAAQLMEYEPDHVRFQRRTESDERSPIGLNIDLAIWLELMKVNRGMPPRYRDPVIERRIKRFLAQVTASQQYGRQGFVPLHIRDVDSGKTYQVSVSLEQKKYQL